MKINKIRKRLVISIIVLLFCFSTLINPILANPGNDNNDMNESSDPKGKGPNNGDPGSNNRDSNTGDGNKKQNQSQGETGNQSKGDGDQNNNQHQYQKREGDKDGDDIDDHIECYQHRTMTMICEKNRTRIRSEWQQEKKSDIFEISFSTADGPIILFDYITNTNMSKNDLSFNIAFKNLIEYIDDNNNGRYDENDTIVTLYSLTTPTYTEINYTNITSQDGEAVSVIQTSTNDGVFSIIIYAMGNYSLIQNQVISPSEIKIDFVIENYSFSEEVSFLALETDLNTVHTVDLQSETFDEKQGYGKNEHELNISSLNHKGFFSWLQTVIVDNKTQEVNVTVISSIEQTITDEEKDVSKTSTIYFCYPQGESIIHDPKIGVMSISFSSFSSQFLNEVLSINNIIAYLGICIFAAVLFISAVFLRKRM